MTAVCQQYKLFFYLCLLDVEESSFFRTTLERCKVKPCNYHIAGLFLYFDKMNCINLSRLFLRKCFQQHFVHWKPTVWCIAKYIRKFPHV